MLYPVPWLPPSHRKFTQHQQQELSKVKFSQFDLARTQAEWEDVVLFCRDSINVPASNCAGLLLARQLSEERCGGEVTLRCR